MLRTAWMIPLFGAKNQMKIDQLCPKPSFVVRKAFGGYRFVHNLLLHIIKSYFEAVRLMRNKG
jgi:hypothetical protein